MPIIPKITHSDYYDVVPSSDIAAGDIWSGLPSHGFIGTLTNRALVITPACDLSNRKVDVITYLPIVSIREYFGLSAFLPELYREIEGQLKQLNLGGLVQINGRYSLPSIQQIDTAIDQLCDYARTKLNAREELAVKRAIAGYQIVRLQHEAGLVAPKTGLVRTLFGESAFEKLLKELLRNAYRLDLHFLPHDKQEIAWSAVPAHSVVLFRYAFSAPVEVLECAQDTQQQDWRACVSSMSASRQGVSTFAEVRPIKLARLKPRFLSDLLTRYVAMYVRLGSPDFSAETISTFATEIEEER